MSKSDLSERDISTKYVTPALKRAGWDDMTLMNGNQHLQWQIYMGDGSVPDLFRRNIKT